MRTLTDGERKFLLGNRLGSLATLNNGAPHVVPVTYIVLHDCIWVRIEAGSRKHKNLLADARVSFSVYTHHPDEGVTICGNAEFVSTGVEYKDMLKAYYATASPTLKENPFIKIVASSIASWHDERVESDGKVSYMHQQL